jgi:hypothetical protein
MIHRIFNAALPGSKLAISLVHTQYCDYCSFIDSQGYHWQNSTQRDSLSAKEYAANSLASRALLNW